MFNEKVECHTYAARIECSYLLRMPEKIDQDSLLIVSLHGYGSNAEAMLRLMARAVGSSHVIASLQAPNQHYVSQPGANAAAAYNWGIRQHWQSAVQVHHEMVKAVITQLRGRLPIGPRKTVLAGFSQPVGLNYRFAGTEPGWIGGVMGICGGVPRDWEAAAYQPLDAAILHIARDEDEFYSVPTALAFPDRLRKHAVDVEFHMLPGAHRFPSKAGSLIQAWLARVFGGPSGIPKSESR